MGRTNLVINTEEIPLCISAPETSMHRQYSSLPTWSQNIFKERLRYRVGKLTPKQLDDGVDVVVDGVLVDYSVFARVTYHVYVDNIAQYKSLVADIIKIDKYNNPQEGGDQ